MKRSLHQKSVFRWGLVLMLALLSAGGVALYSRSSRPQWPSAPHDATIYGAAAQGALVSPFNLNIEPMERLLLLNFDDDPDEVYLGFEPQVFDDDVHGQGLLVIGWRVDGYVDVYYQPSLRLEAANYSIAGQGLANMVVRPMEGARFEITPSGVDADIRFDDLLGRPVELRVLEHSAKAPRPFSLLAPMGSAAASPHALPLVFLHEFYFVRRANSELSLKVDGRNHQSPSLPVLLDGSRVHFVRYAGDPLITTWNTSHDGPLVALEPRDGLQAYGQGVHYDLTENHGQLEIQRMRAQYKVHEVAIEFSPAFPNLLNLREGATAEGAFRITAGAGIGRVAGTYQLERHGDEVNVQVTPSGGWQPDERKWSVRLMYRLVPAFTDWPKTYHWTATLDVAEVEHISMRSSWARTE